MDVFMLGHTRDLPSTTAAWTLSVAPMLTRAYPLSLPFTLSYCANLIYHLDF